MMITAHSGCDRTGDNSLAFLHHALALPVAALEVDVRKNGAGELILSHDETDREAVRLADAFELLSAHPEKRMNCDLKQPGLEEAVVALAKTQGVDGQLIFTGLADKELFVKGRVLYPQVQWFANLELFDRPLDEGEATVLPLPVLKARLLKVLDDMQVYEAAGINWHYRLAELVWREAKERGIGISVWTVDDPAEQQRWLAREVENITSRNISALRPGW